jgi:Do/DeqQ family serine protease
VKQFKYILIGLFLIIAGGLSGFLLHGWVSPHFPAGTVVHVASSPASPVTLDERPESRSIKDAAKKVTPTVVFIESSVSLRSLHQQVSPDQNDWQQFLPGQRVATSGSGVIISADGFILTNHHVIQGAEGGNVTVELSDRRRVSGVVAGSDPSTDLAVIKIEAGALTPAVLGNSDLVEVGDWVLAVGNPFRLRSTVTAGIVSALGRDVEVINDRLRIEHFIQTDAAINRGNSGGALVNLDGQLIGINTAIASESGTYEGYGFAIPINMALKIAADLMEFGAVKRGLLGVQIASVGYERAKALEVPLIGGVEIVSLSDVGFARNAGLKPNDVIIGVNGRTVLAANELQAQIAMMRPGDTVKLDIWREKKQIQVQVELMDASLLAVSAQMEDVSAAQEEQLNVDTGFGFSVMEVLSEQGETFDIVVTGINRLSGAYKSGLRDGDRIIAINGSPVTALFEMESALKTDTKKPVFQLECEKPDGARAFYVIRKP